MRPREDIPVFQNIVIWFQPSGVFGTSWRHSCSLWVFCLLNATGMLVNTEEWVLLKKKEEYKPKAVLQWKVSANVYKGLQPTPYILQIRPQFPSLNLPLHLVKFTLDPALWKLTYYGTLLHLNFTHMYHALYAFLHEYWLKWIIRDQRCCTQTQSRKAAVNPSKALKFAWKDEYCSATLSSESHVPLEGLWWQDSHPICVSSYKSWSAWRWTSGAAQRTSPGAEEEKLQLLRACRGQSAWPVESSNVEQGLSKGWVDSQVCLSPFRENFLWMARNTAQCWAVLVNSLLDLPCWGFLKLGACSELDHGKGVWGLAQLKFRHLPGPQWPMFPAAYREAQTLPEGDLGPWCFTSALKDEKAIQNPLVSWHSVFRSGYEGFWLT